MPEHVPEPGPELEPAPGSGFGPEAWGVGEGARRQTIDPQTFPVLSKKSGSGLQTTRLLGREVLL